MRNLIYIVIFLISVIFSIAKSSPELVFGCGECYNWGRVDYSEGSIKCSIRMENPGTDTLIIKEIKPGCGCTKVSIEKKHIEPNGYTYASFRLSLPKKSGKVRKGVKFITNIHGHNTRILYLEADVNMGYELSPKRLILQKSKDGNVYSDFLVFTNTSDENVVIDSIHIEPPYMEVLGITEGDDISPNKSVKISTRIDSDKLDVSKINLILFTRKSNIIIWGSIRNSTQ